MSAKQILVYINIIFLNVSLPHHIIFVFSRAEIKKKSEEKNDVDNLSPLHNRLPAKFEENYRVFIKYCVISKILKYILDSVSVCVHWTSR